MSLALETLKTDYYRLTVLSHRVSIALVIKSFKGREAERIYRGRFSRKLPHDIQRLAARKLEMLAAASQLKSLRIPPSNRLEKLKGDRSGQHSIRINDQWRICFVWKGGDAREVEIADSH